MVDPDAPDPSAPAMRSWLHWMVLNLPAPTTKHTETAGGGGGGKRKGDVAIAYRPPTPPSGTHRYIFIVAEQSGGKRIDPSEAAPSERGGFDVASFFTPHPFLRAEGLSFVRVPAAGPPQHG